MSKFCLYDRTGSLQKTAFENGQQIYAGVAKMQVNDGHRPMLHNIILILLGLVLFGVLAAILETLGLKNHPYVARTLSAFVIAVGAYIHWGYHNWWTA